MRTSKAELLFKRDKEIVHDLQFMADEFTKTNRALRALAAEAVTFAPCKRWWHKAVPRAWRLEVVAHEPQRKG